MINLSRTYKEIYDCFLNDHPKILIKQEYLLPKVIKEFKKEVRFPALKWYEYTIPSSNNTHIIFFYAESRSCIDRPTVNYFSILTDHSNRYFLSCKAGGYKHTVDSELAFIRQLHLYSDHFIERYNERFLKDNSLSAIDIVCRFISRNKKIMPIELNTSINRNLKKHGAEAKYGYRVRDGFCFTQSVVQLSHTIQNGIQNDKVEGMLVKYATFMNESNMRHVQISAIDEEHREAWVKFQKEVDKLLLEGKTTFILEP